MDVELARAFVARTVADGGATADVAAGGLLRHTDSWYFPRYPEHTKIVGFDRLVDDVLAFAAEHAHVFRQERMFLGAWVNPATQLCYLDLITRSTSLTEALELARRYSREGGRRILAVCNPLRQATEYL